MSGRENCSHKLTQWPGESHLPSSPPWMDSDLPAPVSRKDRASVRDCGPLRMMLSEAATAIQPSRENGAHRGNLDSNKILQLNSNKIQIWREKQNEYRAKKRVEEKNTPTKAKQHLLMSRACILSNMKQ